MKKVCVVGAGTMGRGIAQVFAAHKYQVYFMDAVYEQTVLGKKYMEESLSRQVIKGRINEGQKEDLLNRVILTESYEEIKDADLVIDAIYESIEAKVQLFTEVEKVVADTAILATNTSSLSISEIAEHLEHKQRFLGLHFFNPAPVIGLVEVIGGKETKEKVIKIGCEIAEEIGKVPVRVKESPGFVVNRILIPMINESIGVFAEGVASAEDIDIAMKLGANFPMGPLALSDLIGNDIVLHIMEVLQKETGQDKYLPHPYLVEMVKKGELGRKSGAGFYSYKS